MNLKDYLHYYLYGNIYEVGVSMCQLMGIGDCYYTIKTRQGNLLTLSDRANIKLVLRRLEDMTEEQMAHIWQLIFNRPFHANGNIVWIDKEDRMSCKRFVMMSGIERIGIEMNGNIWADCDLSHHKFGPNAITHYLLQEGFDLFGLIDAGLAIDAKTLNP